MMVDESIRYPNLNRMMHKLRPFQDHPDILQRADGSKVGCLEQRKMSNASCQTCSLRQDMYSSALTGGGGFSYP